jgi:hypothetical protein
MAAGFAGQSLIVVPEHDLVAAFTAGSEPVPGVGDLLPPRAAEAGPAVLCGYVLPAIMSDEPQPPDAQAAL